MVSPRLLLLLLLRLSNKFFPRKICVDPVLLGIIDHICLALEIVANRERVVGRAGLDGRQSTRRWPDAANGPIRRQALHHVLSHHQLVMHPIVLGIEPHGIIVVGVVGRRAVVQL